jgi:hypothetical protein
MDLRQAIQEQQEEQYRRAVQREEDDRTRQQRYAKIVGYDASTGHYLISENSGGAMAVRSLTNASLPVGAIVSYFKEDDSSPGFVDAIGSG